MITAREAAYLALVASMREEQFLSDFLSDWVRREQPDKREAALAYELASGTMRRLLTLEHLATQVSEHQKLSLKRKEKALVCLAIYQLYFLDKLPDYAVVDESVALAKKYGNQNFASFLNALLRKVIAERPEIPQVYSIRYSYPQAFIDTIIKDYGKETALKIFESGNERPSTMARKRPGFNYETVDPTVVKDDPGYYIQNQTPGTLMSELAKGISKKPKRVLDLCASPGGKLIAVHDLFPDAELVANDAAEARIPKLRENCEKYGLQVEIHVGAGENLQTDEPFDLIILDVPCSNTGVLNKRPEARWQQRHLEDIQARLLEKAVSLLAPEGEIWYMTCSIQKSENEKVTHRYEKNIRKEMTILPDHWSDGGYGCALSHFS